MVLHTDEPHPHVHMVVKAVSEQGVRLNIRKATLRMAGVRFIFGSRAAANATERVVRGETRTPKLTSSGRCVAIPAMRAHSRRAAAAAEIEKATRSLASPLIATD
jgi:hypothetical protein